jgi:hypothetical protein
MPKSPGAAGRETFSTWGHSNWKRNTTQGLQGKALGDQVFQTSRKDGSQPPGKAMCTIFISHQPTLAQFLIKLFRTILALSLGWA